ncbi:MAG: hypothetical protein WC589_13660 [Sphingobacterium sp.]
MKTAKVENLDYLVGAAHSPQIRFAVRFGPASDEVRTCFGQATDIEQVLYSC